MPTLTFLPHSEICPDGATISVEPGISVCDAALSNGISRSSTPVRKSCACTTCHVHIRAGFDSLAEPTETEEDYLDKAWGSGP